MGQAILPKLLRCIEETYPITIMIQVTQHRIPDRKVCCFRRNLGTLPISGHGSSSQSFQPKARQSITSLTLAILRRFSLSTRFGIGFAKSERSRKEMNVMKTATAFLAASGCKSAAHSETGQTDKPAFNVVN